MKSLLRVLPVVAVNALVFGMVGPAFGHASYESSEPPDQGTVSSPPSEVTANFSEPLAEGGSYMDVTDPCGRDVGGETSITADSMTVQMSGSAKGEYIVRWRANSSIDTHTTTGEFTFTSTGGEPCPREDEEAVVEGGSTKKGGSGDSSRGSTVASGGNETTESGGDRSTSRHRKHGGGVKGNPSGASGDEGDPVVEAAADESMSSSALDGIPVAGFVVTLIISALIGAAAGKIYFSLSGEAR